MNKRAQLRLVVLEDLAEEEGSNPAWSPIMAERETVAVGRLIAFGLALVGWGAIVAAGVELYRWNSVGRLDYGPTS